MAINDRVLNGEETMAALQAKAAAAGDEFTIRVSRREHPSQAPTVVATLDQATIAHFVNPERWVPQLVGGGNILLQGYHAAEPATPIGGLLGLKINGPPRDVDPAVMNKTDWCGPTDLKFPLPQARNDDSQYMGIRSPPAPGFGDGATGSQPAWSRQAGGGFNRPDYGNGAGATAINFDLQRAQHATETERRKVEEERLANERQKHRDELESMKKSHDADMRALKLEIMGTVQARPVGPDPAIAFLSKMMEMQAAAQAAAEARAAEDRREARLAQERAEARFAALLEKISERPKEDPLATISKVAEILNKNDKGHGNEAQLAMMKSMAEMSNLQVGTAMDFVQAAAELQLGQQGEKEPGWVKGIDRLVKGVGAMARGSLARQPVVVQQPQAPAVPQTFEQQAKQIPPAAPPVPPSVIDQFEAAIRNKVAIADIAGKLLEHFQDPSIQAALAEPGVDGDFEKLIQKRLGNWHNIAPENAEYLKALFVEIENRLIAAGVIDGDEPEAEGEYEEEPEEVSE